MIHSVCCLKVHYNQLVSCNCYLMLLVVSKSYELSLELAYWVVKGKGKADHARMGVGGVLISLTLAVSP